jgi:ribosomal subunit interface protein
MDIVISGKHIDIGDSLRHHIQDTLTQVMEKYFNSSLTASVVVSRGDNHIRTDIAVHIGRGIYVRVHADGTAAYTTYDNALKLLEGRLRRYKHRLRDHHRREASDQDIKSGTHYILTPAADQDTPSESNPVVIAEMPTQILRLSVNEAIMHLELNDIPAYIFFNKDHGGLSVVYRRTDGNVGWIDPQIAQSNLQS